MTLSCPLPTPLSLLSLPVSLSLSLSLARAHSRSLSLARSCVRARSLALSLALFPTHPSPLFPLSFLRAPYLRLSLAQHIAEAFAAMNTDTWLPEIVASRTPADTVIFVCNYSKLNRKH